MDKITVLVVDDSSAVRDGLQSILGAYPDIGVVGEATDGVDAIAKAEQLHPRVILMDAQMPNMDGIEATRHIKERLPNIKILLLTVHIEYVEAAMAAGADGHLLKDSGRQELVQAIRELSLPVCSRVTIVTSSSTRPLAWKLGSTLSLIS